MQSGKSWGILVLVFTGCVVCRPGEIAAAGLQPATLAAFDQYVDLTERRMAGEMQGPGFVLIDSLPTPERLRAVETLRRGGLLIDRLATRQGNDAVEIPGGLVHHWAGLVFVPGATLAEGMALLQDYDRAATVYAPAIARSRTLEKDGDTFRAYLRFVMRKGITVVLDTEHQARFVRLSSERAHGRIASTSIREVEEAGSPEERHTPAGQERGYLWRLNTWWRLLERDGGLYLQCESVSLTRRIPRGLGWLIGPFVTSIPRESLTFTLETTRTRLARPAS